MASNNNQNEAPNTGSTIHISETFFDKYKKAIIYGVVAVIVIVAGAIIYNNYVAAPRAENASTALAKGQEYFGMEEYRAGEERIMKRLLSGAPCVLASGGGAFVAEQTRKLAKKTALTIWLKADIDVLYNRTAGRKRRPFLQCSDSKIKSKLQTYIDEEYPYYSEADIVVETKNEAVDYTVGRVLEAIQTYRQTHAKDRKNP